MTTEVKVNAHAGWDVEVKTQELNSEGAVVAEATIVVTKHTEQSFFIHSHRQISSIKELKLQV